MKKIRLPKQYTDRNIFRCILLNINNQVASDHSNYRLSKERYDKMIYTLIKDGIVGIVIDNGDFNTSNLFISDIEKYDKWSRNKFYYHIEKYLIPVLLKILEY